MVKDVLKAKKYILSRHFVGEPKPDDLTLVSFDLPAIKDREILVEAVYLSVDPYMRPKSSILEIGDTMIGSQVAKVIESKNPEFPEGEYVVGYFGWTTHHVYNPDKEEPRALIQSYLLPSLGELPKSLGLGALGLTGNAAYFGFLQYLDPKQGKTLVVSAAAGAVGSHVGQMGKMVDMKVIGITGSDAKCKWLLDELKFDHAINYKTQDVKAALKKAAPDGVDCYFDNVGGEISSIVIYQMKERGLISVCGSISSYNSERKIDALPKATIVQPAFIHRQLHIEGFCITKYAARWSEGTTKNLEWINDGKMRYKETVTEGFENMFEAFIGMLRGENIGKAIVKV